MFVTQTTLPSKLQLRGTAWRPSHAGQTRLQLFSPPRHPPRPSLFQANANTRVQTAPKLIAFRMYLQNVRLSFELPRRLHLTRLLVSSYALHTSTRLLVCSAAGPVLRSSPHLLLWRGGAQLRRGTARDLHRDLARAGWCMHSPPQLVETKFRNPAALLPPNWLPWWPPFTVMLSSQSRRTKEPS